ncbi:MAG TPA: hypothetical protein VL136_07540 [Candidatus Babeliales bacterium]|jgi:hypothetical protein|nr:hypothetical protein [Candidatus Babeliales bacterium]
MKPYHAEFPVDTDVRIADLPKLERFRREWRFHHPLEPKQLDFAGRSARVTSVGFYHGGDVLYTLDGIPGIWYEECVHAQDNSTGSA